MSALPVAGPGVAALPEGGRVDFGRLRRDRRRRLLAAMAVQGLDVLVLGRPANITYASGARQLWTAGSRPFGPGCVVVAGTGRVHLLSTWDEGVPPEVGHDDLYGLSWNPARVVGNLRAIPGLAAARRVGTDGVAPGTEALVEGIAPEAALVDGGPALMQARAVKTPDEVACIVTAAALAEGALAGLVGALRPGVTERELLAVHAAHIAAAGVPAPPTEGVVCATPRRGAVRLRRLATGRAVGPGELVVLQAGCLYAGYEARVGRTWLTGSPPSAAQRDLARRCRDAHAAVVAACRSGVTGSELKRVWQQTGAPPPPEPLAHGVGLGMEPPVVAAGIGDAAVLAAGTVVSVQSWMAEEGAGGMLEQDLVFVGEGASAIVTRFGRGPAAGDDDA